MTTRALRYPEVCRMTGLSRATIQRRIKAGKFPPPRKLSSQAVRFLSTEVEAWLFDQPPVGP